MRRSIFKAGAVTVFGFLIAFAIVSANSNTRHAATAAPAAKAIVANASASDDVCSSEDVCCARETKVTKAAIAAAPRVKTPKAKPAVQAPAFQSGIVVAKDPETGELGMPTPEQMHELQGSVMPSDLNNSDVGLVDVQGPKGAVIRDLQGRFQETSTVTIAPNGKLIFGCGTFNGAPASPTQPAPSALEEK